VPAATPMPRGPTVLTLYGAEDLLTGPGCPVCRYVAEGSDRYLGWFALEGHGEPATITVLCDSLGMCARHTRRLMSQPGAAIRLTAVYRYVVTAARDRLAGRPQSPAPCPGCRHDDATTGRALDTLLDGLADSGVLHRYQELGGLCLPHLAAAAGSGRRRTFPVLAETTREAIAAPGAHGGWLAGTDRDAEARAVLRRALPLPGGLVPAACQPCLARAQAEYRALARLPGLASDGPDPAFTLCACHLADAATAVDASAGLRTLLAWQERCLTTRLHTASRWLLAAQRRRDPSVDCPVCRAGRNAAGRALADLSRAAQPSGAAALCVRHDLTLCVADPRAGKVLASAAVGRAEELIADLADAFDRIAEARNQGVRAVESDVWRLAAAFLDGAVFGGCPPRSP
jgi:hypothetical protein